MMNDSNILFMHKYFIFSPLRIES